MGTITPMQGVDRVPCTWSSGHRRSRSSSTLCSDVDLCMRASPPPRGLFFPLLSILFLQRNSLSFPPTPVVTCPFRQLASLSLSTFFAASSIKRRVYCFPLIRKQCLHVVSTPLKASKGLNKTH